MKLLQLLARQPKGVIILIALSMVSVIAVVDYYITIEISLSIFYILPIILVTWCMGIRVGKLISLLSAILWFVGDNATSHYPYAWMPYWNAGVRLGFFLIISLLLDELKKAYEREKHLARTDGLTGLNNGRFFLQLLEWEMQHFRRHQRPFTLVYLDVDNFKTVNDNFGHSTGDKLLCLISHTLTGSLREVDRVARLGGDEFAIVLPETDYDVAETVLKRLQEKLLQAVSLDAYPVSFSIGAVTFLELPESPDKMIEQVDHLMYDVKKQGKDDIKHQIFPSADLTH